MIMQSTHTPRIILGAVVVIATLTVVAGRQQTSSGDAGSQQRKYDPDAFGWAGGLVVGQPLPIPEREVANFRPVTDEMLGNPPPGDWLTWRRSFNGHAYSPLNQINRDNVRTLRLAWEWAMPTGRGWPMPLVHDGVIYLPGNGNTVQAIDGKTGDLIWQYREEGGSGAARALSMYQDKVFVITANGSLTALHARTGKRAWQIRKQRNATGPTIAGGVVIAGAAGCRASIEGCPISGHDPATGKQLWQTSTIAAPSDPHAVTWGTVPPERRGGGETWMPGTFDPELNLFYIGTSQAKPWMAVSRGMKVTDAALYTASTLALDPKTGRIAWHFQHVPGETFDMEPIFERVLIDVERQKLLFTTGKEGILWKLDRQNGTFLGHKELVFQNLFESIDSRTGKITYRSDIPTATIGDWVAACPGYYGGHNWQASAYSPEVGVLIIPLIQSCMEMRGRAVDPTSAAAGNAGDVRFFEMPGSRGNVGRLSAVDARTMRVVWDHQQRAWFTTSAVTTAGGLVFIGDADRYFKAFDVKTGRVLWQVRLGTSAQGYAISYSVGPKQYVAVTAAPGSFRQNRLLTPEIYHPDVGNTLYVFELPDRGDS